MFRLFTEIPSGSYRLYLKPPLFAKRLLFKKRNPIFFHSIYLMGVGRDSSVGIAARYGLYGPGFESRWGGVIFSAPIQTGPGVHPASYTRGTESFSGVKRSGPGVDHRLLSSADVKERVDLYLYSTCGPS